MLVRIICEKNKGSKYVIWPFFFFHSTLHKLEYQQNEILVKHNYLDIWRYQVAFALHETSGKTSPCWSEMESFMMSNNGAIWSFQLYVLFSDAYTYIHRASYNICTSKRDVYPRCNLEHPWPSTSRWFITRRKETSWP